MDHFYRWLVDYVVYCGFTNLFTRNDRRVIDGGIDGICRFTVGSGRVASFLQSGMLQYNLVLMVAGAGALVLFFVL
jgi:NADH-quinone oxidoreductase subunit L